MKRKYTKRATVTGHTTIAGATRTLRGLLRAKRLEITALQRSIRTLKRVRHV